MKLFVQTLHARRRWPCCWCCPPSRARPNVPHTVQPGETLWSIAAANNFTTRSLAAANGLSEDAQVVVGTTIQIPSEAEAAAALARPRAPARHRGRRAPAPETDARACSAPTRSQPGDTLSQHRRGQRRLASVSSRG